MESIDSFGHWMRLRRKALNLTQAQLAENVGCALVTIKKFEQETRRPSQEMADLLADALAIPRAEQNRFVAMARGRWVAPDEPSFYLPAPAFLQQPVEQSRSRFVGRESQLDQLQSFLAKAVNAEPQFVLLRGEPGQGKTSLLQAFARKAEEAHLNLVVATGLCTAHAGQGDPFLPFRDLFDQLTCDLEGRWLARSISAEQAHRLWKGLPQVVQSLVEDGRTLLDVFVSVAGLCARIEAQIGPQTGGQTGVQPAWLTALQALRDEVDEAATAQSQHQLFEQVTRLFKRIAQAQPLLLILDDLQWIDESSQALLFHLSRRLAGSPIMVLLAYRSNEVTDEHGLFPVVNELTQRYGDVVLDLDERNPEQDRGFVESLVSSELETLPPNFCDQLFQHTSGHPLFTVEILRHLQDRQHLQRGDDQGWVQTDPIGFDELPPRVDAVISQRIGTLPPHVQELLRVASVEGEYFTVQVVAHVLGIDERSAMRQCAQLVRQQRLLREHSHLQVGSQYLSRYQFSHALFQQYLYQQQSRGEQRLLHGAIGSSLEDLVAPHTDDFAVILAYHFEEAGNDAKSSGYHFAAGKHAQQSSALGEAIGHFRSALDSWAADDLANRGEIIQKLATCLQLVGQQTEAISILEECSQLYTQLGNNVKAGDTRRWIARLYWEMGQSQESWANYWKALAILESLPDSVELAEVSSAIGQMYMIDSEFDQAVEWCERAIRLAKELNAEQVVAHAMNSLGASLVWKQEVERGIASLRESIERSNKLGLGYEVCRGMYNLGGVLRGLGRYREAKALAAEFYTFAKEVPAVLFVSAALTQGIESSWVTGQWEKALGDLKILHDWQLEHPPSPIIKIWADTLLGTIYNDLEMTEPAERVLWGQIDLIREIDEIQLTLPALGEMIRVTAQSESRGAETLSLIRELVERIEQTPAIQGERFDPLLFAHGWLLKQISNDPLPNQEADRIQELANSLATYIEEYNSSLQIALSKATVAEMRGNVARQHQEFAQAKEHYRAALAHWHSAERPTDLLRALAALEGVCEELSVTLDIPEELMQEYARLASQWQKVKTTPSL